MTALVKISQIQAIVFDLRDCIALILCGATFELENEYQASTQDDCVDPLSTAGNREFQQ